MSGGATEQGADAAALKALGPGWRCEACEYSLEGLGDGGEETRCPECGYVGRPVGARPVPGTGAVGLAIFLSIGSLVAGGWAAWFGWIILSIAGSEGWIAFALGAGWAAVAVMVFGAADRRWAIARWLTAIVPAASAALGAWWAYADFHLIPAAYLCFGVLCVSWLIYPELARWLRRPPGQRPPP